MDRCPTDAGYLATLSSILAPPPEICRRFNGDTTNPRSPSETVYISPGSGKRRGLFSYIMERSVGGTHTRASNDRKTITPRVHLHNNLQTAKTNENKNKDKT